VMSGDKRKFAGGSLRTRTLPLPLMYQVQTAGGHDGAVRAANNTHIVRSPEGLLQAWGTFGSSEFAADAITEIAEQILRGVSVDVDDAEFSFEDPDGNPIEGDVHEFAGEPTMVIGDGRISGATLCSIPAFQEAWVALGEPPAEWLDAPSLTASAEEDGEYGNGFEVGDYVQWEGVTDSDIEETRQEHGRVASVGEGTVMVQPLTPGGEEMGSPEEVDQGDLTAWAGPKTAEASGIDVTSFDGVPGVMPRKLKAYWTHGEGAARIAWGSPGDFNRCKAALGSEGVPTKMLAGACANLHKAATGDWPGREKAAANVDTAAGTALTASLVASGSGTFSDYADPRLGGPTPLTVTDDGRVFGHLATWGTCHVGFADQCITAPSSASAYAYFTTGEVLVDGISIPVGQITMGTGHARATLAAKPTVDHYDHTGTAIADVAAGEDAFGVWVAGRMRDTATPEQTTALRAAALSGDWRRIGGSMELVAALAVNVPGFPIPRTKSAMSRGRQSALVASGIVRDADAVTIHVGIPPRADTAPVIATVHDVVQRTRRVDSLAASIGRDRATRARLAAATIRGE